MTTHFACAGVWPAVLLVGPNRVLRDTRLHAFDRCFLDPEQLNPDFAFGLGVRFGCAAPAELQCHDLLQKCELKIATQLVPVGAISCQGRCLYRVPADGGSG